MKYVACKDCGETIDTEAPHDHECAGSPADRISALEERITSLEEESELIRSRLDDLEKAVNA